ncbi:terpene synthase family protein [Cecembia rubra]|uniref:Terpene synthase n=1 Tax=Cecembia rubra TaxID=1485585 RepID=A0A2P8DVK4_9BACT|nr:terpene synthase [Cecembia rubra]PSL01250.1 CRP-like cAMP-binding protein [Cecembia rubra]
MKKSNETLIELKDILDKKILLPIEHYQKLLPLATFHTFKKNELIREELLAENEAHFIIEGCMALFDDQKIIRPFFKGQIGFDAEAFYQNQLSRYKLIALRDTKTLAVSKEQEHKILAEIPELSTLSQILRQQSKKDNELWMKISQMHYKSAIPLLSEIMGESLSALSRKHLAELLGVNARTIDRFNKKIYQNKESIPIKTRNREIFNYPFSSEIHPEHEFISNLNWDWLGQMKLLTTNRDKAKFQKMQLHALACRLFPEASFEAVNWISKLFVLFFMLDDYTDKLPPGKKAEFWMAALNYLLIITLNLPTKDELDLQDPFKKSIKYLWNNLKIHASDQSLNHIKVAWSTYFKSCIWEASNMDKNAVPSMEHYLQQRPLFSGGNLALQLIPFTMEDTQPHIYKLWPSLQEYLNLASRLIFISNDLLSFEKEMKLKDPHNWVYLHMYHFGWNENEAKKHVLYIHDRTLEAFLKLDKQYFENYLPENQILLSIIKKIKYQVSGAVAWSVTDTYRYLNY